MFKSPVYAGLFFTLFVVQTGSRVKRNKMKVRYFTVTHLPHNQNSSIYCESNKTLSFGVERPSDPFTLQS